MSDEQSNPPQLKRRRTLPLEPESGVPPAEFFNQCPPVRPRASAPSVENRDTLLNTLNLNALPTIEAAGGDDDYSDAGMERLGFAELKAIKHRNCFACQRINQESLKENELFLNMMKLYKENVTNACGTSVYKLVKEYFDEEIKPVLDSDPDDTELKDWPLEVIQEHFERHTNYATDEIIRQINITTALRDHLMNNLVKVDVTKDKAKYDVSYIKVMISLNQEIRKLRAMKKDLPTMIGFDHVLNH